MKWISVPMVRTSLDIIRLPETKMIPQYRIRRYPGPIKIQTGIDT